MNSNMQTITVPRDNAPSIRFIGELLASATSTDNQAAGSRYSGQPDRWEELALYRTKGGKYVCHQVTRTLREGERDCHRAVVCITEDKVKEFFGYNWLARELYSEAGIDDAVDVE